MSRGRVLEWNAAPETIGGISRKDVLEKLYSYPGEQTIFTGHRNPGHRARIKCERGTALM